MLTLGIPEDLLLGFPKRFLPDFYSNNVSEVPLIQYQSFKIPTEVHFKSPAKVRVGTSFLES